MIQSQVQCVTQDRQRHLWVGTFGGLDRFDGSSFKHFTKADGLNSSGITCLYTAKNGDIWAGTFKGITVYDGFRITNYPVQQVTGGSHFATITEDDEGHIWALNPSKGLFIFNKTQFIKASLPIANALPTCLYRNDQGQLIVSFYKLGLYTCEKGAWRKLSDASFLHKGEYIVALVMEEGDYYALSSKRRLLLFRGSFLIAARQVGANNFGSFCLDHNKNIWIGTDRGVVVYKRADLSYKVYGEKEGLSDNFITEIFRDAEDNLWIGTDGDGLFQFSGGAFAKMDNHNGLPGKVVMGIVATRGRQVFLGTREGGLVNYHIDSGLIEKIDYSARSKAGINCMASNSHGDLYIGTMDNQLLRFNGTRFTSIWLDPRLNMLVNSIVCRNDKTWIAGSAGCFYIERDSAFMIPGIEEITLGVLPLSEQEVLVASNNGMYQFTGAGPAQRVSNPLLQEAEISCLCVFKNYILIGTIGDGLYLWNRDTDRILRCDSKEGLSDNQVFSIHVDEEDNIWVGTGTGLQQVRFDLRNQKFSVSRFSKADGYENFENNLNTIIEDSNNNIWIGTTRGAFIYSKTVSRKNNAAPHTVIQQVNFPGELIKTKTPENSSPWYNLPVNPVLHFQNNEISFSVKGILLKNPEEVMYQYELAGYDTGFSEPVRQTFFNYQNLEPGEYIFRVKSKAADRGAAGNVAEYAFTISTPFYKSGWFLFLLVCLLILSGALMQVLLSRARQRKQRQIQLVREEEQEKVRLRTSEDFHDELGNKLTRISLLADILQRKMGQVDPEKSGLIKQIKDNVQSLYTGTKDVIWSLSSGSDNLSEIMRRIAQFGEELFHDSGIEFSVNGVEEIDKEIKLPADYSRNIIMIFKEALNNSLRHAKAANVVMTAKKISDSEYLIFMKDDGVGLGQASQKRGNGMNNISRRALRIGGVLDVTSKEGVGTTVTLSINIPSTGG